MMKPGPPPQRRMDMHSNEASESEVSESTASTKSIIQYNNLRNVAAKYQSSVYNKPKLDTRPKIGARKK